MYYNFIIKKQNSEEIIDNFSLNKDDNIYFLSSLNENNEHQNEINFTHYTNDLVNNAILKETLQKLLEYKNHSLTITLNNEDRISILLIINDLQILNYSGQPRDTFDEKEELLLVESLAIG